MALKHRDLGLASYDDIFETDESREDKKREKIMMISIADLDDFPGHPFRVVNDGRMQELVESIKKYGVHTPAIARLKEDGKYELISGHRRKLACKLAKVAVMPVIVREMTLDEATIMMVDSNLQREELLFSEKAFSYKMRLDAMKRQVGRPGKDNSAPMVQDFNGKTSREILSEAVGESHEQIRRYIRLTELIPEILEMVDEKVIAFRPAVEISYLTHERQKVLYDTMGANDCTPSLAQAIKLKKYAQEGRLSDDVIDSIMSEEKPNQVEQFKMPKDRIRSFFPEDASVDSIQETIVKALELYRKRQREQVR